MFMNRRTTLLAAATASLLAACGQNGAPYAGAASRWERADDRALGAVDAPVTVIEYASLTCTHCRSFHEEVWPELKSKYVDTGEVRFIFRELPTAPIALAMGGFLVARCAPEERYFDVLDVLFERQQAIFTAAQSGGARDELLSIARSAGVSEEQFSACVTSEEETRRIAEVIEEGQRVYNVSSTPTFVINGETFPGYRPIEFFDETFAPLLGE